MKVFALLILTSAIVAGQLIKLPILNQGGVTILDIAVIALSLLGMIRLKFKFKKPPLFLVSSFLFILIATLSLVATPLHLQLIQYLISFLYIVRFSSYILLGWEIYEGAFPFLKDQITNIFLSSGIILAVLGLLQFIFLPDLGFLTSQGWDPHYFRTVSTFLDPNFAGAYFTLTLLLLLFYPRKVFFIIVFAALLTTFSRSSYLMFLISGVSLSILQKSKTLFIKIIILFVVLLIGFQIYTELISEPRNIDRGKSAQFRLSTWQQGALLFQQHPILGVGFNAYRYALKEYKLGDEEFLNSHGASSNDSSLLFVASTTGILGLLCYVVFLGLLFKRGIKDNFLLATSILGLLVHSIFSNSLFFPPILLWLTTIYAVPKK